MVMEPCDSAPFQRVINGADLVTPDGRPLVWALRSFGVRKDYQVRGTDLTAHLAEQAAREGVPIGLYGGTPEMLGQFVRVLETRYPRIRVACRIAPPFRPLTPGDEAGGGTSYLRGRVSCSWASALPIKRTGWQRIRGSSWPSC
jgi:N-acetylglucosaminyldiphosphoundecaprenol N-acetyl-beta-D-mannosaminyltransferase